MVQFSGFVLASLLAQTAHSSTSVRGTRRLSRPRLGFYEPASTVTDHAAIDQDQKAIEELLGLASGPNYSAAKAVYEKGGSSKPYALLKLSSGTSTAAEIPEKTPITGLSMSGQPLRGVAYSNIGAGNTVIKVKYGTSENAENPTTCKVGGLQSSTTMTAGCFAESGTISVGGVQYEYSYDVNADNGNGRTIQGFSTQAGTKMYLWSEYKKYLDYYGDDNYGDKWVTSALTGTKYVTETGREFDFSKYDSAGRVEAIKKGTVYMNIYQYVLHEFEDAIADCSSDCTPGVDCNAEEVHAWDEGVAFYTGSLKSYLLYTLADKRCQNYGTCGTNGEEVDGTSSINFRLANEFAAGRDYLLQGDCEAPKKILTSINELMAVPLIQGMLRYAYKVDNLSGGEKEAAEGSVFMAAVIPRIHACDKEAADTIFDNMSVGKNYDSVSFDAVRNAVESQYKCLGITCADIGGLLTGNVQGEYYDGFSPCNDYERLGLVQESEVKSNPTGTIIGIVFGVVAAISVGVILYMRKREKEGAPIFVAKQVDVQ